MGLAGALLSTHSKSSLKQILEASFREESITPPPTPDSYFRVSKISSVCAREEVLCAQHEVTRKETFDARSLLIFLHGSALHWGLQNNAFPAVDVLYGCWKCLGCGSEHGGVQDGKPISSTVILRPKKCSKCGLTAQHRGDQVFQYKEHYFISDEHRITGHPDGFIVIPGYAGMGILEAKSVGGKNAWEVKKAPNIGHVIQAQLYMWFSNLQWAQILYWNKGEYGIEAFSEFHIERDDETINNVLSTIASIRGGMKSGILPDRICQTNDCPRANLCSVAKKCFATER